MQEVAMRPDDELLGVVVHSGLVLCRRKDVVTALRRITAFPAGLVLDTAPWTTGPTIVPSPTPPCCSIR
jgi:hypothetical protein